MKHFVFVVFACFYIFPMLANVNPQQGENMWRIVSRIGDCVDVVGTDILSALDELEMRLIDLDDNPIDKALVSVFGEQIVEERKDHFNIQFQYGVPGVLVNSSTTGSGSIIENESMGTVSTGATAVSSAQLRTKRRLRYKAGREAYGFFTAAFVNGSAADSTQWIGLFDDENGIAVGYNGTTFSILYRRDSVDTIISQSSFNRDTLDGMGDSGFTIDPTKLNVFRLSYGWLGSAPLKFQVLNETGCWITFHLIERPNSSTGPSFLNPILPITSEVNKTAGSDDLRISSASWSAGVVGVNSSLCDKFFSQTVFVDQATFDEKHVVSFRNKTTFAGKPNVIEIRISGFGGGPIDSSPEAIFLRLRKDATVSGLSFADVNPGNSTMEFSTSGTYTGGTGRELISRGSITSGNGPGVILLPRSEIRILLTPGEMLTITSQNFSSNMVRDITATLWWEELI